MRPLLALLLAFLTCACRTTRSLEITSNPQGAEIRLDGEVIGRTPLEVPFEHFGTRRVTCYLDGYRTQSVRVRLKPRWYSRFPLDLITEILLPIGLEDRRKLHVDMVQGREVMSLPSLRSVIERASVLRHSGPEGPRDLPDVTPAIVPGAEVPGTGESGAGEPAGEDGPPLRGRQR